MEVRRFQHPEQEDQWCCNINLINKGSVFLFPDSNLSFSSSSECSPEKKISTTVTRRQRFTSYLRPGKGILLAANPSDRNAKLDLLVGLCSRVLNPINTLLNSWLLNIFEQFFVNFRRKQMWRSGESTRLPLMWPGIESSIPNSTRSLYQYSHMASYEALWINSNIVLFRTLL